MSLYDDPSFFESYSSMERSQGLEKSGEWHLLKPLFPPLSGKSMLDLGCGFGWHCRYACQLGASRVLGIDASNRMIEEAISKTDDGRIIYRAMDLQEYEYPEGEWDFVFSNLALHYVSDLESLFAKVHRTLKSGGLFLFNIEHPVFTAGIRQCFKSDEDGTFWPLQHYFSQGERETVFLGHRVAKQHHTLTGLIRPLLSLGFSLEALEEVYPSAEDVKRVPEMEIELERPMMLIVKAVKI